jgi:hypothetical protein
LAGIQKEAGLLGGGVHAIDLQDLVQSYPNLEFLCLPFSTKEIDEIILDLPSDKAPGPDGLNNLFFKKS